jgi:hypothetical protein
LDATRLSTCSSRRLRKFFTRNSSNIGLTFLSKNKSIYRIKTSIFQFIFTYPLEYRYDSGQLASFKVRPKGAHSNHHKFAKDRTIENGDVTTCPDLAQKGAYPPNLRQSYEPNRADSRLSPCQKNVFSLAHTERLSQSTA